jgi:hypothetical protein
VEHTIDVIYQQWLYAARSAALTLNRYAALVQAAPQCVNWAEGIG